MFPSHTASANISPCHSMDTTPCQFNFDLIDSSATPYLSSSNYTRHNGTTELPDVAEDWHNSVSSIIRSDLEISHPSNPPAGTGCTDEGSSTESSSSHTHEHTHNLSQKSGKVALEEERQVQSTCSSDFNGSAETVLSDKQKSLKCIPRKQVRRSRTTRGSRAEKGGGAARGDMAQHQRSGTVSERGSYDKPWRTNMKRKVKTSATAAELKKPSLSSGTSENV